MTAEAERRRRVGSALRLAGLAIALTVAVVLAGWAIEWRPAPAPSASLAPPAGWVMP